MLKFKTAQAEKEFYDLNIIDARIQAFGFAAAAYATWRFGKDLWVTCVARYHGSKDSPHFVDDDNPRCRAIDIRVKGEWLNEVEELDFKRWARLNFPRSDMLDLEANNSEWSGMIRHHGEGDSEHFHCVVEHRAAYRRALGVHTSQDEG